jgi:hypothetical protein
LRIFVVSSNTTEFNLKLSSFFSDSQSQYWLILVPCISVTWLISTDLFNLNRITCM